MRKPLFVTLATGATLLVGGGVAVAMAGEPVRNSQAAVARQTVSPTDEPSITPTARPSVSPSVSPSGRPTISRARAEAIALSRVGGGQIESTELEFEDGRLVWDVDVIRQGVKWEVEIDSRSGQVVEFKADGDRRGDGRDDDHADDRGDDHGDHHGDQHGDDRRGHGDDGDDNSGPGSDNSGPGGDSDNSGSGSGD